MMLINQYCHDCNISTIQLLHKYWYYPTNDNWSYLANVPVLCDQKITFWQAVCHVDPSFPVNGPILNPKNGLKRRCWIKLPSKMVLVLALKYVNQMYHIKQ